MNELILKSKILVYQMSELTDNERQLVEQAIKSTEHSYAPFSHFHVGAALLLANGNIVCGCSVSRPADCDAGHCCTQRDRPTDRRTRIALRHLPSGHCRDRDKIQAPHSHLTLRTEGNLRCRRHQGIAASGFPRFLAIASHPLCRR